MPLLSLTRFKEIAGIPVEETTQDPLIEYAVTATESDYLKIRGRAWDQDASGNPVYPDTAEKTAFEMAQFIVSGLVAKPEDQPVLGYPRSIAGRIDRYLSGWS